MKTNKEHRVEESCKESGNALIYVLIAIVLFAALSFTLSRQTDTGEAGELSDNRAELYATQLISYTAQAKSALDQMVFSGARIGDLDFRDPSAVDFNSGTQKARSNRVFHPEGGGLTKGRIPDEVIVQSTSNPPAGWYLGRFNNVEWTKLGSGNGLGNAGADLPFEDVILVAYQIRQEVCEKINEKINGSIVIPPVSSTAMRAVFVDDSFHTDTNVDFTTDPAGTPQCADCHETRSLCVRNVADTAYAFYTVVLDQ